MTPRVLVLLIAIAALVRSPSSPAVILGWVDLPSTTVAQADLYVAGWAVRCDDGEIPSSAAVGFYNLDTGTWWLPSITVTRGLHRPDVVAMFASLCPRVTADSGYAIAVSPPPPPGHWRLAVAWASADGPSWSEARTLTITP